MGIARLCEVQDCRRKHLSKGYCNMHYIRFCKHPLYSTWASMMARCTNPKNPSYSYYGGRGISVCSRWYNFDNYKTDISLVIGDKPTPKHSIDRIDNNKGYEPENIRWATRSQQLYNQRLRIDNKSGIKGVRWDTKDNKWFAYFNFNKKMIFLGRFDDKDKAIEARRIAELEAVL